MTKVNCIAQPSRQTTLQAIQNILSSAEFDSMNVAAAYATTSGVHDLVEAMNDTMGDHWSNIEKKWITSFDYCRTHPLALNTLSSLPNSKVRVFDAEFCLSSGGAPKVPFHPKAYLFSNDNSKYALTGSGNLSRSGLSRGHEAGLVVGVEDMSSSNESSSLLSIRELHDWYSEIWHAATILDVTLLTRYKLLYESQDNLKNPVPTEDDIATSDVSSSALSNNDLRKLRACSNLWIEAGNITRNRGLNLPGNQLMMKRMTRVFFGFTADELIENSSVGTIVVSFDGGTNGDYSLTYSDNQMDKLTLPMPGSDGPRKYDSMILHFEIIAANHFLLRVFDLQSKPSFIRKSDAVDGSFTMRGGREWGVY